MNQTPQETYEKVCSHVRETALLGSVADLLGWDERTKMPVMAGPYRAEQLMYLAGQVHRRATDPQLGEWLAQLAESDLASDPHSDAGANIRQLRREFDKQTKLPQRLVEELSKASVLGQQVWVEARKNNQFSQFQPALEKIIALKIEQAEAYGYAECRYDALMDDYEPQARSSEIAKVLEGVREQLVPLVREIVECGRQAPVEILERRYPRAAQEKFGQWAAGKIGFNFHRGRLDETQHPFCSRVAPHDCRLTTRYDEAFFSSAFFGTMHEAGHGLYEQGLPPDEYGLPLGSSISLGVHESQSRLWENLIGRSRAFWRWAYPEAQRAFPEALGDVKLDDFFFAVNDVRPSLIRVEADEATYNLHILVRFELEQAIINDGLSAGDLPGAWREKYQQYLGISPPDDADGVMQDVHWSAGLIGYFATYTLGNLYASQLYERANADLGGIEALIEKGNFAPLLEWLTTRIYEQGQRYSAAELMQNITGEPISHEAMMRHLRGKLETLYGLK